MPNPGNPQSLNRYAYVFNNPLRYADPTGYDPLGDEWQGAFRGQHGRDPEWQDRLVRLFSIAFPDEWDWSRFYTSDGSYIDGSLETVLREDVLRDERPVDRYWADVPQALENLAGYYDEGEESLLTRDIGTLFGGLPDRFEASAWSAVSDRDNPTHVWVYVNPEGLPLWLTGDSDKDANIHHWAWGLTMGYEYYGIAGSVINTGREFTQFEGDFRNTWSDIVIGNAGAALGCAIRVLGAFEIKRRFGFYMMQW